MLRQLKTGLTSEGLDKDLHATAQAQHQVQRALLLDVVVGQGAAVLQLLAREDQALLVGGNALLVLQRRQAGSIEEGASAPICSNMHISPAPKLRHRCSNHDAQHPPGSLP